MVRRYRSRWFVTLALLLLLGAACGTNGATKTAGPSTQSVAPTIRAGAAAVGTPVATAASAPPATPSPAAAVYPITIRRSDGKDLVVQQQPRRIASLSAGTTEILYAIGAQTQIVATDTHSDFPETAKSTPKLDAFQPSPEAITGAAPDIVLLVDDRKQIVETLDTLGIPVLYLNVPGSVPALLQQIQLYGDLSGHRAEAQSLVMGMSTRIDNVRHRLADVQQGPRLYHEIDPKLYSATPGSFIGDLYTILKAQNIVPPGDKPYPQLTQEFIVAQSPEVIIVGDTAVGVTPQLVKGRSGWTSISAVENNRVYAIDDSLVSRPGPRIVDALDRLAKLLYPDRF